jgi:two-component system OmpR family sensor kinase
MDGFKRRLSESVQFRLSVVLSAAILLVALVAGVFAFVSAFDEALEMQDNTLRQMAVLFERQSMTLGYPAPGSVVKGDDEESRIIVQYLADGARASGGDTGLPLALPTTLADGLSTQWLGDEAFRVLVRTLADGQRIVVAQETGGRDRDARESAWRGVLPFLILFPVLLIVVADLVRKMFRPIATLAAEVEQRDEGQLHPIDEGHLPVEIRAFGVAINGLLARVAQSMEQQQRFVADAAHELRSPLTALSLQGERLAATPLSDEARARLLTLQRGIERGKQVVEQLLSFARAQASAEPQASTTSVHQVYRQVLEDLLPLAARKGIDLGVEPGPDVEVAISELDLHVMIRNLVDNAIRYTPHEGRVDLGLTVEQGGVRLWVRDNGPGIAPQDRERVFDPFYRSLGSDEVGSGLGLSIVRAIAVRHGMEVSLQPADPGSGRGVLASIGVA